MSLEASVSVRVVMSSDQRRVQKERRAATIYGEHMAALHAARFAAARDATALRQANGWHQRHASTPAHTRTDAGGTDRRRRAARRRAGPRPSLAWPPRSVAAAHAGGHTSHDADDAERRGERVTRRRPAG